MSRNGAGYRFQLVMRGGRLNAALATIEAEVLRFVLKRFSDRDQLWLKAVTINYSLKQLRAVRLGSMMDRFVSRYDGSRRNSAGKMAKQRSKCGYK